jgi:hypothetical protein
MHSCSGTIPISSLGRAQRVRHFIFFISSSFFSRAQHPIVRPGVNVAALEI